MLIARSSRTATYVFPLYNYQLRPLHCFYSHRSNPPRKQLSNRARKTLQFPADPKSQFTSTTSRFSTSSLIMASDDAYASFLDKANSDLDAGRAQQQGGSSVQTKTVHNSLSLPKPLKSVDAYYVSETDEPFEPVALPWEGAAKGKWPSASRL